MDMNLVGGFKNFPFSTQCLIFSILVTYFIIRGGIQKNDSKLMIAFIFISASILYSILILSMNFFQAPRFYPNWIIDILTNGNLKSIFSVIIQTIVCLWVRKYKIIQKILNFLNKHKIVNYSEHGNIWKKLINSDKSLVGLTVYLKSGDTLICYDRHKFNNPNAPTESFSIDDDGNILMYITKKKSKKINNELETMTIKNPKNFNIQSDNIQYEIYYLTVIKNSEIDYITLSYIS